MLTAGRLRSSGYSCDKLLSSLRNTPNVIVLSVIVCPALPIRVQLTLSQMRLSIISKLLHPALLISLFHVCLFLYWLPERWTVSSLVDRQPRLRGFRSQLTRYPKQLPNDATTSKADYQALQGYRLDFMCRFDASSHGARLGSQGAPHRRYTQHSICRPC